MLLCPHFKERKFKKKKKKKKWKEKKIRIVCNPIPPVTQLREQKKKKKKKKLKNKGKPTDPPPGLEKRILRSRPCVAFLTFFPNRQPSILGEIFFKSVIAQWCWCRTEALEVGGSSPSGGFFFFPEFFFWASVHLAVTQFFLRLC